jgi:hypothetical protein
MMCARSIQATDLLTVRRMAAREPTPMELPEAA